MADSFPWFIFVIFVTFFLAGVVKGVTGMGLPTVAMGVMGAIMPPVGAAALLIVPSFVTNVWQLFSGPRIGPLIMRFWLMMIGIVAGTVAGSFILASANSKWTTVALGAALVIYAKYALWARPYLIPTGIERWGSPMVGLITGVVTGGTGVFVIPAVPYLQALGLNKDDLVQAFGLSFTVSTVALAVGLAWRGALQIDHLGLSALAVVPALIGMWVGQEIRKKVSPPTFRRWFLICLILLGAQLMLRPLF